uniref:Homeobox domain-containing protein n=1 Tax=Timema tahoe TaxID=61484 RepID=A0A7R9IBK4_9NEOP|nr:unnamed protein product [Timema tahoe]
MDLHKSVLHSRPNSTPREVWFQNKRSKERRLKQLTSMGRGPFFGSSRKMRGFPMNLSPGGLDEPPPGFPYFATADGKFEFGYGGPAGFHHEFFPGHHPHQGPPGQPLPFNGPGGPMDQGPGMPMGGEFGGLTPEPPPGFLAQPPPTNEQLLSQRASPEFMSSQGSMALEIRPSKCLLKLLIALLDTLPLHVL